MTIPPELGDYAVLGLAGVSIHREATVLSGAVGALHGAVILAGGVQVGGAVAAPKVRLGTSTHVGRLFCVLVTGPPSLPSCHPFPDPLVDPMLLSPVTVTPGTDDLRVPRHTGTTPVAAGSYRDVRVGAGGVLRLSGGPYTARSIRIGRLGRLVCVAPCRLGVLEGIVVGQRAEFGTASTALADTMRVDLAAGGAMPVFEARKRATVAATIYAPAGRIVLGPRGSYRGAYVGRTVSIGVGADVRVDSAL